MKQPIFMPIISEDFDLYYWSENLQSHNWVKNSDKSLGNVSDIEPLFRLHSHDAMEFLIFLGGECDFFCEGKTYNLRKGDVVIIPPYAVHKANVKNFDNYERVMFTISTHLMADFLSISPSMKEDIVYQKTQGSYVLNLNSQKFQDVISLLQDITIRRKNGGEHHSFALHYLLFQTLQLIFNPSSSNPDLNKKNELDQRFVSILEYIESHLTDTDLSLDQISNHFHLNKYYFSHYFKGNMNFPFYRYVSLKRLARAVTMIKQNQHSIEEIAIKCGFTDYSSFYRLFKKEYNLSPKNLQKEFRK
ncbi:AraC family transcriptional regulator [Oceanobacillus rekensis]|uniref:AraC family transcriptional regulator n=1 Tax=Oceanobacillus rekensis TaxID=937927 RepID=UPI000B43CBE5|nr:AraC family transcriptional regulator [Oceanobacillus rekensis]